MNSIIKFFGIVLSLFYLNISFADIIDNYHFVSPIEAKRFDHLLSELRCVVCQNQNLAESHAPLAQDLKKEVYNQIRLGYSDTQIKNFLVNRYGEYILFKPNMNRITFVLWLGPVIFLVGSVAIVLISVRRQKKSHSAENS